MNGIVELLNIFLKKSVDENEIKLENKLDKNQFEELQSFLKTLNLLCYLDLFIKNSVTLQKLLSFKPTDLDDVSIVLLLFIANFF